MAKMPFGAQGGRLHNTFPPGGRYGGPNVAEKNATKLKIEAKGGEVQAEQGTPPETSDSSKQQD